MSPPPRPLEIVGGGLAGLSLGLALARRRVPVTLYEAGTYPRHRVCGEFIAGLDPETVAMLGLGETLADALPQQSVQWFVQERAMRTDRLPRPALGISRHQLDARLAEAFAAAGGRLRTSTRCESEPAHGRVFATGRRRGGNEWLGLKLHARRVRLAADLEVHLGAEAYIGLSHVEEGAVNICGLFRRRDGTAHTGPPVERLFSYLHAAGLSQLAQRLRAGDLDQDSFCAVAGLTFAPPLPARADTLEIGDTWAVTPPFTGNGMAMAFQSAAAVIEPLLAYAHHLLDWPKTCALAQRLLRDRFQRRLRIAGAMHPFLLQPKRQKVLGMLHRANLVPFRPLYSWMH
jgi:flavin-dependent dehydrogenase